VLISKGLSVSHMTFSALVMSLELLRNAEITQMYVHIDGILQRQTIHFSQGDI